MRSFSSKSFTPGSHEFYLGYAVSRGTLLTLDAGHYHPTEGIADKISSVLQFLPEIGLHVSRGVRWDSDHVVILDDELQAIAKELIRSGRIDRVHIGLDFFDASINRVALLLVAVFGALVHPAWLLAEIVPVLLVLALVLVVIGPRIQAFARARAEAAGRSASHVSPKRMTALVVNMIKG